MNVNNSTRDERLWYAKQLRAFGSFQRANQNQTFDSSPPPSYSSLVPPTTPGPTMSFAKVAQQAAGAAPDILNGFSNLIGSIGGVVNQARANDIYSRRVDYENEQFKAQLQQQNAQFGQSLQQNQHQFDERLNFQTVQMDRAWKTANAMGLASPFQSQAPARINPSGSNDGFVNLGNYAQQMTFGQ